MRFSGKIAYLVFCVFLPPISGFLVHFLKAEKGQACSMPVLLQFSNHQFSILHHDPQTPAGRIAKQMLRNGAFHLPLQDMADTSGSAFLSAAPLRNKPAHGIFVAEFEIPRLCLSAKRLQLTPADLLQILFSQTVKGRDAVDPPEKFRAERGSQDRFHLILLRARRKAQTRLAQLAAAQIGGHDDHSIPKIHLPSDAVRILIATYGARIVSNIANYVINAKLVFKSNAPASQTAVRYFILSVVQAAISYGLVLLIETALSASLGAQTIIKMIVDMSLAIASYQFQMRWVFANKKRS